MECIEELKLELKKIKMENEILKKQNSRLKKDIEYARILFKERDTIATQMKEIKVQQLEDFNLLLKFSKEGIMALDSDLRIIYSSNSFFKLLGSKNNIDNIKLKGSYVYDVYSRYRGYENAKQFCDLCRECFQTQKTIEEQLEYKCPKDGSNKYTTFGISPVINENGEVKNLVIILKDVTEFYEMKRKAEDAGKAKTQFLANMSHEIRTPMNVIIGMVELIMKEDINDTVRENLYNIKSSSSNLLGIINDILDISKVELGKTELIEDEYEIRDIIYDISNIATIRIDKKDIDFLVEVAPNMPHTLYGDKLKLRQIIINLVNNAIKFTHSGFIKLNIEHYLLDDDMVKIKVSVEDTGIGIKQDDLDKLFKVFNRVDTRRNRDIEGTGLGLAISKSLVHIMGGSINVESEYERGSKFSFTLIQKIIKDKEFTGISDDKNNESFIAPEAKVLIVDDNALNLKVASGLMSEYNMQIDTALSGYEALKMIRNKKYDIIFMDHMMYGMDGLDATKEIRSIDGEYYKNIPIVALTANAISGAEEMFLSNSMNDFLSKPIDKKQLHNILNRWIKDNLKKNCKKEDKELDSSDYKKTVKLDLQDIDYNSSIIKNGLNTEDYIDILKVFYNEGKEKIKNLDYYCENNLKRYIIYIHAMKSSAESIGAYTLAEKARVLEESGRIGDISTIINNHNDFINEYKCILDSISNSLNKINTETKQETFKEEISKDEILKYINDIKIALDDFESHLAIELLHKIKNVKLDKENKKIIEDTLCFINMFEYSEALNCISKINI